MIGYPLDVFERFEDLTGGGSCGFRRTGYLLGVDERMQKPMEASVALQRGVGIETRLVSPSEMREIEPRMRVDDLVAGCYEPDAGYCNPAETAQGFARAARARGARILEDTEVLAVRTDGDRVTGVDTTRGPIDAPRVVNAAGLWGLLRRAARLASHPGPRGPRGQLHRGGILRPRLQAVAGGGRHDGRAGRRGPRRPSGPRHVPALSLRGGQADSQHLRRLAHVL